MQILAHQMESVFRPVLQVQVAYSFGQIKEADVLQLCCALAQQS